MMRRSAKYRAVLFAIAHATIVFSPIHFGGVGREVGTGNVVMRSEFCATQAREE